MKIKKTIADICEIEKGIEGDRMIPDDLSPQRTKVNFPKSISFKKIPPILRRHKTDFTKEPNWYKRNIVRLREDSQFLRSTVQYTFVLLCVWIGIEFFLFMQWGQSAGSESFYPRPPGVEGFLPISAIISLKYWLQTGIVNTVHPSGLFILLAIIAVSLLLKKAFCSWLCPVGTLSESLWMFGEKIFGRNLRVPRWLDYPLRSLKYVLMLFFVVSISSMDVSFLKNFIESPYNKVADIKMYLFFANISSFALITLIVLAVSSVLIKNFWCRYLCPYGALLGVLSIMSPLKITRKASTCIDCELCTKACPSAIKVHTAKRVWSDECMSCYACVEVCPVKDTLAMRVNTKSQAVPSWIFGILLAGVFIAITGLAMIAGRWQNGISKEEYAKRIQNIESPLYQHNRGHVPDYGPND
jgi:polyferredoxin